MVPGRNALPLGAQAERLAVGRERSGSLELGRLLPAVTVYLAAGLIAIAASLGLDRNPLECDGWLGARGLAAVLLSLGVGLPLAAMTIAATRFVASRSRWAPVLHSALRPAVHGADGATLLAVAAASSAGEELLFRGLLVPTIGVVASSLVFGGLHQVPGRARWMWMSWATIMGLLFGALFAATGSLAGALVAHLAINHANLRFLRDHDPDGARRPLGGLLHR